MLRLKYLAVAAAVILGAMASVASADDGGTKFVVKQISAGPRPYSYVLVRSDTPADTARPYALTGQASASREQSAAVRATPTHPRGTHDPY